MSPRLHLIGTSEWGSEMLGDAITAVPPTVPRRRQLSARAMDLLDLIQPWARDDPDIQAVFQAGANELDRLDAAIENVVSNFFPQFAADYLHIWEAQLGIAVNPPLTIGQRQTRVMAFVFQRQSAVPSRTWVANVTALLGPGWSWSRHIPGSSGGVSADTLRIKLAYVEGSPQALDLIKLLEVMTPANMAFEIDYGHGFIVQYSPIQIQPL